MKTINQILEYNLTIKEKEHLYLCGIVNGCGGKGGKNFNKILKDNIDRIPGFDKEKADKLYNDIRDICLEHDIDYRFKKGFYKSNYRMSKKLYKLLSWAKFSHRLSVKLITLFFLCKYGKKFYNQ